ncbi:MAG: hypothetical protein GWN84_25370 [Gammaproteobacteria bacterium]|nr:hypothetical protein [Gammaproteobacteria bacterium]NIR90634.1 hypothetical protein [Gammaproteobacteria bacterium]NIU07014.1 hypothetical protein [Gammaproteobacteria bacterium]NIV53924.1 hypothetical protein [Gammaproteobacteria bacterium]NIX88287.1 hypothetical protein [Gammaproteobacteria bacterium]
MALVYLAVVRVMSRGLGRLEARLRVPGLGGTGAVRSFVLYAWEESLGSGRSDWSG